ncbi:MAG: hypothetical protein HQK54_01485 [Oligoflexales bacterium]|nr:hypothetical protein [Oligoflexales bacterium]
MNQEVANKLKAVIRDSVKHTLEYFGGIHEVTDRDYNSSSKIDKDWMSLILLVGEDIKMSYITFFCESDIVRLVETIGAGTEEFAHAHVMREFSNCVAGRVKQVLGVANIITTISLPLCTSKINDIIFFKGSDFIEDSWIDEWNGGTLINRSKCQVINWDKFNTTDLGLKSVSGDEIEVF